VKLRAGSGRRDLPDLPSLIETGGLPTRAEIEHVFDRSFPDDQMGSRVEAWLGEHYPCD
jgi:hypothetical protein